MQRQSISHDKLMLETREVLLAAGIRRAWAVPTPATPLTPSARVLAALADELPSGVDPVEHVLKLEWVLHSVHGEPVTVRLYFREQVLPSSAVPLLDVEGDPHPDHRPAQARSARSLH